MSEVHTGGCAPGAIPYETGQSVAALGAADWLYLAATPTFAMMALLTGVIDGGSPDPLCSTTHAAHLGGMVAMYLLMSAFHLAPWLKLISHRRNSARRC